MLANQEQPVLFSRTPGADKKLRDLSANELVFAVVGPVGSGTSWVANSLSSLLKNPVYGMDPHIIKASNVISNWASKTGNIKIDSIDTLTKVTSLQDAGDAMRASDPAAVAVELIAGIRTKREEISGSASASVTVLKPAGPANNRRVYILDSLKHPAEVELLRICSRSFLINPAAEAK